MCPPSLPLLLPLISTILTIIISVLRQGSTYNRLLASMGPIIRVRVHCYHRPPARLQVVR
ncbi:hypothetical protein BDZ94DRAFT_1263991 [Collybia nuda]|uniref:Uncharacterized protein n=1 Tax=Collybia nuda TaxID=64659 RepID=A0A9P5Y2B1_9AGAR|nr:hypothetical protein BDZ94DRAFT_1263991 [Collybia nuda]